jgi:hypothetical protein
VPNFFGFVDPYYFLEFIKNKNVKKIAYAVSFGKHISELNYRKMHTYKNTIQKFSTVLVREKSGIEICKKIFGVEAFHVLDPAMLLEPEDYRKHMFDNVEIKTNNVISYILDESDFSRKICNFISTITKKKC